MISCPLTPLLRFPRFRSAVEVVAVALEHLALVAHRDLPGPRATQALPDLRVTPVNVVLLDQKALEVFRVPLDLLAGALEEPRFPDPKDLGVPLVLLDQREIRDLRGIMVFLVPLERTGNPAPRVIAVRLVPLVLLGPRVLPDLLENVVPLVRMRLPPSSTSISPRTRQPRPTERRQMSKTLSDRPTRSRMVLGTTLR